jgi:hypothetical protein
MNFFKNMFGGSPKEEEASMEVVKPEGSNEEASALNKEQQQYFNEEGEKLGIENLGTKKIASQDEYFEEKEAEDLNKAA